MVYVDIVIALFLSFCYRCGHQSLTALSGSFVFVRLMPPRCLMALPLTRVSFISGLSIFRSYFVSCPHMLASGRLCDTRAILCPY
jgi:hypothetical protein